MSIRSIIRVRQIIIFSTYMFLTISPIFMYVCEKMKKKYNNTKGIDENK
jgi:hypothetical protein